MAWSRLQSAHGTGGAGSATATLPNNVIAGSKIIVAFVFNTSSGTITSVQDAAANTWTQLLLRRGTTMSLALYALDTPAGDVGIKPAISVVTTGGTDIAVLVQEVSGLVPGNTTAMLDGATVGAISGAGGSSTGSPTYSSTAASEYLVAVYGDNGGPETYTKPAALADDANSINSSSINDISISYGNSTGTAESASYGLTGTTADWAVLLTAFRVLPSAAAAVSRAQPGRTWLRRFHHPQQPASYTLAAAPGVTPAPLYPLTGPIQAKLPVPPQPAAGGAVCGGTIPVNQSSGTGSRYGRIFSNTGIFSGAGPAVTPANGVSPAITSRRPLPPRGVTRSGTGVFAGTGPAVTRLAQPVRAKPQAPVLHGRYRGSAGTFTPPATPAPLHPLTAPARARQPLPVVHGRAMAMVPVPIPVPVTTPAPLYPLHGPVRAPLPGPALHGRVRGSAGSFAGTGPGLTALTGPATVHHPLPPRGRAASRPGLFAGTGPAVYPLTRPVQARLAAPGLHGRFRGSAGTFSAIIPGTGPAFAPLHQPAGVRVAPFRTGHVQALAGTFTPPTPAPLYPQTGPVRAKLPAPAQRGHGGHESGIAAGLGPAFTPQRTRIAARPAFPVLHGRAMAITPVAAPGSGPPVPPLPGPAGVIAVLVRTGHTQSGPGLLAGTGPGVYPQRGPVQGRPAFPVLHGRIRSNAGAPFQPGTGPAVKPLQGPARVVPVRRRGGYVRSNAGSFTSVGPAPAPLHGPVTARQPLPVVHGRAMAIAALPVQVTAIPAPLYPLQQPIGIGRRAPGPVLHGRSTAHAGVFSSTGPVVTPLTQPVRTRQPVLPFSKGRVSSNPGSPPVTFPAPLYPLHGPIRAPLPGPVLHGRAASRKGTFSGTGPPVKPLTAPVSVHHPLPPQGRVIRHAGTFAGTGPTITPLTGPVISRRPQPTRYGRGNGSPGKRSGTGPPTRPLTGPVTSRRPLPPRGHGGSEPGVFSGAGPSLRPQTGPIQARRLPHRPPVAAGSQGVAPLFPPPPPPLGGPVYIVAAPSGTQAVAIGSGYPPAPVTTLEPPPPTYT